MNLEEMLVRERDRDAPNPLVDRTGELITRVRRRRRARAAAGGAMVLSTLAVLTVVVSQLVVPRVTVSPAELFPAPQDDRVVMLDDVPDQSPVAPGRYALSVPEAGPSALLPVVSVPEHFAVLDGGSGLMVGDVDDGTAQADYRVLWMWEITSVYAHPCEAGRGIVPVGPSVADLAEALAGQPLRAGTAPVPVTVGGYPGMYVELSVPQDVDPDACPGGRFNSWPGRWQQGPGQVDLVWIVDVEGDRLVFDASHGPAADADDVQQLKDMVATATFMPADGAQQ
jgi:hypothetical protein